MKQSNFNLLAPVNNGQKIKEDSSSLELTFVARIFIGVFGAAVIFGGLLYFSSPWLYSYK